MNKYIIYLIITSFFLISTPVFAQTWYSSDIDSGYVQGANTEGRANVSNSQSTRKPVDTSVLRKGNYTDISQVRDMSPEDRKEAIEELKKKKFEERCLIVQKNIDNRKDYYQNSYTNTVSRYQGIIKGLTNMVSRLDERGVDTSLLKSMIANLELMVSQLNQKHDSMISKMVQSRNMACDQEGIKEYRVSVQNTMKELKSVREQVMSMRKYIQEQIVNELRSIKEELVSQENEVEESEDLNSEDNTNE